MIENRNLGVRVVLVVMVLGAGVAWSASAQTLPADQAEDYLGTWALAADFEGNTINLELELVAEDGVVKAALGSAFQPEPQLIETISRTDEGLLLAYDANFGGNSLRIQVRAALEEGRLLGTFGDEVGLFSADFVGERAAEEAGLVAEASRLAADTEQAENPRRRRFGSIIAEMALGEGEELKIHYGGLKVDSADHERILGLGAGEVFTFDAARAIKLITDVDLLFGETRVVAQNLAPNYPGTYALWLKRVENGWRLVFNEQGDVWGTQYKATTDVAEVPLEVAELEEAEEELLIELIEETGGGRLRIAWGNTAWSAPFRVE